MKRFSLITKKEVIKKVTLFVMCLSFVSVFAVEVEEAYPPAVMAAGEAVYQIEVPAGRGTGFFIAPNRFVTNFHIVDTIQDIAEVSFYFDNELSPIRAKKLLAVSYPYDLALLETEGESSVYLSEGSKPQTTETVFTAGYPTVDGGDLKYHHSTSDIKNWQDMYYSGVFNFGIGAGASGSPVLNSQGQFFGVIFGGGRNIEIFFINSYWLELLTNGQAGMICQNNAQTCVRQEISRAKKLVQQFLADQPVERESLGIIHITGDNFKGVLSESEEEAYVLKMAKDFNDRMAQFRLGMLHLNREDLEQAIYWLTLAAEDGVRIAQYNVGDLHHNQGNLEQAIYWLTLAADSGVPLAQSSLGALHHNQGGLEHIRRLFHR